MQVQQILRSQTNCRLSGTTTPRGINSQSFHSNDFWQMNIKHIFWVLLNLFMFALITCQVLSLILHNSMDLLKLFLDTYYLLPL